jgi:DNA helicase HerA-like ATPase
VVEALVHRDDLYQIDRGRYVLIHCIKDHKEYTGRIVEGPFFDPDALKRDSTPVQFIIMNQGGGKMPFIPEYHGRVVIEILGEERGGVMLGAVRRPHPGSPIKPYDQSMMQNMLKLEGNICLGHLDNYEDIFVRIKENDKGVIPRNWLTVGTIGSGKSNTDQVFIEETLATDFAQVVLDPEGEYIFMDQPAEAQGLLEELARFGRKAQGVKNITVYRPPLSASKRADAVEFSVTFDSLSPELIMELTEMTPAQELRFPLLYEQGIQCILKEQGSKNVLKEDDLDISRGFKGITLQRLITMLKEEIYHYTHKTDSNNGSSNMKMKSKSAKATEIDEENGRIEQKVPEKQSYFHKHQLQPLIQSHQDLTSYRALYSKLLELQRTRIFDRKDAPPLNARQLCLPGRLAVIDMSDCSSQQVANIIIADLLTRIYRYKMNLSEDQNVYRKVIITIEEAHGFVSRERQDKMTQTLDQLRRIARRGRKRWLCLHLITQSPQHLPPELFELANNKIIHQMTGTENLRVLKAAAGMVNEAIWDDVPSLGLGRAVIVSSQYPHPIIARIRPAASRRYYQN